jgi:hypothetical protein
MTRSTITNQQNEQAGAGRIERQDGRDETTITDERLEGVAGGVARAFVKSWSVSGVHD